MKLAKIITILGLLGALAAFGPPERAKAHEISAGDLIITHPRARPNLPNRPVAAYMVITNDGAEPERLIAVRSPGFDAAEIHRSSQDGGVARMEPVGDLEIPAEDSVVLEPGDFHIMLFGARQLYKLDEEFALILTFEKAGEVEINVKIQKVTGHSH